MLHGTMRHLQALSILTLLNDCFLQGICSYTAVKPDRFLYSVNVEFPLCDLI